MDTTPDTVPADATEAPAPVADVAPPVVDPAAGPAEDSAPIQPPSEAVKPPKLTPVDTTSDAAAPVDGVAVNAAPIAIADVVTHEAATLTQAWADDLAAIRESNAAILEALHAIATAAGELKLPSFPAFRNPFTRHAVTPAEASAAETPAPVAGQ